MTTTITAEGVTLIYVGRSEARDGLALAGADQPAWDGVKAAEILERADVRLALFKSVFRPWAPYFLVWATPRDLDALDVRVATGAHTDDDFADSVRTRFHVTRCIRSCGAAFDTLVHEPGDPYLDAPGLVLRKVQAFPFKRCPACQGYLTQLVALML